MKQNQFLQLVLDVSKCHICENMCTVPYLENREYLENDSHGLDTNTPYVNRWNVWQGNLDADIMVIGQDYGQKEEGSSLEIWNKEAHSEPTDKKLTELFQLAFGIDVNEKEVPLFFTNIANCYRKRSTTGGVHSGWLPICANKYMERLIRIVQPKIIIVLGRTAFEALYCMENLTVKCSDIQPQGGTSFAEIIKHRYYLDLDGKNIAVFPVYHPGANSQRNRSFDEQISDWDEIKKCYDKIQAANAFLQGEDSV